MEFEDSAFAKAFDKYPKVTGNTVTVYEANKEGTTTLAPKRLAVERKKPTLILRRPKYDFQVQPGKFKTKKDSEYYASFSGKQRMGFKTGRKLHEQVSSGKKQGKVNGIPFKVAEEKKVSKSAFGVEHPISKGAGAAGWYGPDYTVARTKPKYKDEVKDTHQRRTTNSALTGMAVGTTAGVLAPKASRQAVKRAVKTGHEMGRGNAKFARMVDGKKKMPKAYAQGAKKGVKAQAKSDARYSTSGPTKALFSGYGGMFAGTVGGATAGGASAYKKAEREGKLKKSAFGVSEGLSKAKCTCGCKHCCGGDEK